jgi:hypothetical protein
MEPEGSLPYSQKPVSEPHPEIHTPSELMLNGKIKI